MSCSFFRIDTKGDAIGSSRRRVPEAGDTAKKEIGDSYSYRIKAVFDAGLESEFSNKIVSIF